MKIYGQCTDDINEIEIKHRGMNITYACQLRPLPYNMPNNADIEHPKRGTLEFGDFREVDALINLLEEVKHRMQYGIGEWRKKDGE